MTARQKSAVAFLVSLIVVIAAVGLLLVGGDYIVHAQNNGQTGSQTVAQMAFANVTTSGVSSTFKNIGQSAHFLGYCTDANVTSFNVELVASFDGAYDDKVILASSSRLAPCTSGGAVLQAGGYFQNVRAELTSLQGAGAHFTASYSATAGPISFASPGMGSGGPSSPVTCDQSQSISLASGGAPAILVGEGNKRVAVCGYVVTFTGATAAGAIQFSTSTNCAGVVTVVWPFATSASTPQLVQFGGGLGQLFSGALSNNLCVQNSSGATAQITIAFAELLQ